MLSLFIRSIFYQLKRDYFKIHFCSTKYIFKLGKNKFDRPTHSRFKFEHEWLYNSTEYNQLTITEKYGNSPVLIFKTNIIS